MGIKNEDIERIEEEAERKMWGHGRAGGRKAKEEHHGKKTQRVIYSAVAQAGEAKRREEARETIHRITDSLDETQIAEYSDWLKKSLTDKRHIYNEDDIQRHTYTSGGHGGTGRQTSRNAWDIIHRPTGIRVTSRQSRLAGKNWEWGKAHLIKKLSGHLDAWKTFLPKHVSEDELPTYIAQELRHAILDV